jgi:two-component system nitrogen regulation response regulator NtrX
MHNLGSAEWHDAVVLGHVEDEHVASRSAARVLITAATHRGLEMLARRVHGAGPRAQFPFIHIRAGEFPIEPDALKDYCSSLLDAAAGGSMLISNVEEMPAAVQDALSDWLAGPEFAPSAMAAVRLMSGTTKSLVDRVTAGRFSEQLFYRLNVIHLIAGDGPSASGSQITS